MKTLTRSLSLVVLLLASAICLAEGQLIEVKTKTFDKEKFLFPDDLKGEPVSVLMLAISDEKEAGERQQKELLEWQTAIDASGGLPGGILSYHFPVLQNSFFLPTGIIRGAMKDSYQDKVPLSQAGVLFVKDLDLFLSSANLTLDDQATLLIVKPDGSILFQIKGTVDEDKLAQLRAALPQ